MTDYYNFLRVEFVAILLLETEYIGTKPACCWTQSVSLVLPTVFCHFSSGIENTLCVMMMMVFSQLLVATHTLIPTKIPLWYASVLHKDS